MLELDDQAVCELLARFIPQDTASTDWPVTPPAHITSVTAHDVGRASAALETDGHVVVRLPSELDDHGITVACWNLLTLLGAPVAQYDSGELVYMVEPRPDAGDASHYSASAASGNLHTDGSLLSEVPDIAVLLCLSAARRGGETVLVPAEQVRGHVRATAPVGFVLLREPQPFAATDDTKVRQRAAVVDGVGGIRYLRHYIDHGYALDGAPPSEDLVAAMDAMDAFALNEENQRPHALLRGQALLWMNASYLHGRRWFEQTEVPRRLVRMYARERAESHLRQGSPS